MDDERWYKEIFTRLKDLSDLALQRASFTGRSTDVVLSISEIYSQLFDDLMFDEFISQQKDKKNFALVPDLESLKGLMDKYQIPHTDAEALVDNSWLSIVDLAKTVVERWNLNVANDTSGIEDADR